METATVEHNMSGNRLNPPFMPNVTFPNLRGVWHDYGQMRDRSFNRNRTKRKPAALDAVKLGEIALAYVARYATTGAKLATYLNTKLRQRGWEDVGEPDIQGLVQKYQALGYIDDAAYARSRSEGLLRRGYGRRRVDQALHAAGVDEEIRGTVAPEESALRQAALSLARKRRFGPFGDTPLDRPRREKQIAAMLRAGHGFDAARALVDAGSEAAAEEWAAMGEEQSE